MQPVWRQVAALYGEAAALDPAVIAQLYEAVGGSEAFSLTPDEERWQGLVPESSDSAFTR